MSKRRMWNEVLPAWRTAHQAAVDAQLPAATRAVLEAVTYLLAAHQRTSDHVRLAQIAHEAGIWDGHGECPRSAAAAAGRHLQRLADAGAISYEPNRSRSIGCRISLPEPDPSRAHDTRDTDDADDPETRAPHARHEEPSRAHSEPESRANGARDARKRAPSRARGARAPEGFPEDVVRGEEPEGARNSHNGARPADAEASPPTPFTQAQMDEPLFHAITFELDDDPLQAFDVAAHLFTHLTLRTERDQLADAITDRPPKTAHGAIRVARELGHDIPHLARPKETTR